MITIILGTAAITITLEMYNELKMMKKLADKGYKINFDTTYDINDILIPSAPKARIIYMFIPGLNLYQVSKRIKEFNKSGLSELGDLEHSKYLERMTEAEQEYYKEKPSSIRAFKILKEAENEINLAQVHIYEKDETSKLYYTLENGEFKILRTTGVYNKLTREEIMQLIQEPENGKQESLTDETEQKCYFERVNLDTIEQKLKNIDEDFSLKLKR